MLQFLRNITGVCCLSGMSTHNTGIDLVETLKYKIFLREHAARPQVEAYLTFSYPPYKSLGYAIVYTN